MMSITQLRRGLNDSQHREQPSSPRSSFVPKGKLLSDNNDFCSSEDDEDLMDEELSITDKSAESLGFTHNNSNWSPRVIKKAPYPARKTAPTTSTQNNESSTNGKNQVRIPARLVQGRKGQQIFQQTPTAPTTPSPCVSPSKKKVVVEAATSAYVPELAGLDGITIHHRNCMSEDDDDDEPTFNSPMARRNSISHTNKSPLAKGRSFRLNTKKSPRPSLARAFSTRSVTKHNNNNASDSSSSKSLLTSPHKKKKAPMVSSETASTSSDVSSVDSCNSNDSATTPGGGKPKKKSILRFRSASYRQFPTAPFISSEFGNRPPPRRVSATKTEAETGTKTTSTTTATASISNIPKKKPASLRSSLRRDHSLHHLGSDAVDRYHKILEDHKDDPRDHPKEQDNDNNDDNNDDEAGETVLPLGLGYRRASRPGIRGSGSSSSGQRRSMLTRQQSIQDLGAVAVDMYNSIMEEMEDSE